MDPDEQTTIYNKGFKAGTEHRSPSSQTLEMIGKLEDALEALEEQWRTFKTWALVTLVGSVVLFVGYGVWVGTVTTTLSSQQHQIDNNADHLNRIEDKIDRILEKL